MASKEEHAVLILYFSLLYQPVVEIETPKGCNAENLLSQENKNGTRFESVPSTYKNFENIIDFENVENILTR